MKWLLIILILCASLSYAELYADVEFAVDETGLVSISGETNYEPFSGDTNELTSKEGPQWILNISTPVFSEYIYHIRLPPYATINYIKANSPIRIEDEKGTLTIIGTSSNEALNIVVQYSIGQKTKTIALLWYVLLFVLLVSGYLLYKKFNTHKTHTEEKTQSPKATLDRKRFTERQLEIIDYLEKHGTVTQAEVEKALHLPKSSLSRNIETLVQKGTIFRESKGMSNVIGLKE